MIHRAARYGLSAFLLAGVGGAVWLGLPGAHAADTPPPPQDIPVDVVKVAQQNVPVRLAGLGTVQAFSTLQVKAQVSGTLIALPVPEGQEVHKGDVVAEIDPRPYQAALDQANAQRQEDQAQLQSAALDLTRYQNLAARQFAAQQQVDDQLATVNKLKASIAADTAAIETAQINLGYCTIKAPINGRISLYAVDAGNIIQAASQTTGILTITQDKPIAVVFTLPEAQLLQVQQAQGQGTPAVQAVAQDGHTVLASGTLMTPNNAIDTTTGTISLKAKFDNSDDKLWPGEFVNARIQVQVLQNALTVPLTAVQHGPDGMYVYVVKPDQTVAEAKVQAGYQTDQFAIITSGVAKDETVVVSGQSRLAPGTHVKANTVASAAAA